MSQSSLEIARSRIADCFQRDAQGLLVQRRDYLNLSGLGLSDDDLFRRFVPNERDLPEIGFGDLAGLQYLDLTRNRLSELPVRLVRFSRLRWLGLNFNCLVDLNGIGQLSKLERLYLRRNMLSSLPDAIRNLTALVELDLHGNAFSRPNRALLQLLEGREASKFYLDFGENPGEFTLRAKDGLDSFREHVRQLLEQGEDVREGKLLLVGEGNTGKSTLLHALRGGLFFEARSQTHGLKMLPLVIRTCRGDVRLNCWDFSGQQQLRETHQIFFTEPAIYLLVWRARERESDDELRKWLWLIKHRTNGKGRVLVVGTETHKNPRQLTGEHKLREEFGGPDGILLPPEFYYVECDERPPSAQRNIDELVERLADIIEGDPSFCQPAIRSWHRAQDELATISEGESGIRFMSWVEFETFCIARGIPADDVRRFARHQHEVGRVVWVDRGEMAKQVILSPDWLSKALGYIVHARPTDDPEDVVGLMSQERMHAIWRNPGLTNEEGRLEPSMPEAMFSAFRAFMEEFDMAHAFTLADGRHRYFIPQRLRPNPPAAWTDLSPLFRTGGGVLRRRIDLKGYDGQRGLNLWLLRAFFFRLMVRFHPYMVGREDAALSPSWERGFCIEDLHYGKARITIDSHHLDVEAQGVSPHRLWLHVEYAVAELRDHLKRITTTEIRVEKLVPCKVDCAKSVADQGFLPETVVFEKFAQRKETVGCRGRDCYEDLPVSDLVGVVNSTSMRVCEESGEKKMDELLNIVREMRQGQDLTQASQQRIEAGLATIASAIRTQIEILDEPSREGPCLFLIVPRDAKFFSDRGKIFGKAFRLHLYCERSLRPVSFLRDTTDKGVFDFEMSHEWWQNVGPYLKFTGRLLSTMMPAAGLLGVGAEDLGGIGQFQEMTGKMQEIVEGDQSWQDCESGGRVSNRHAWDASPVRAEGGKLLWLHTFLREQCKTPDLWTSSKLGLQRTLDKTTGRYLWLHHSQT